MQATTNTTMEDIEKISVVITEINSSINQQSGQVGAASAQALAVLSTQLDNLLK
ncbi:hypothetical protein [Desulfobulbus alkaliphilus]|uniref:hypothetical protein n=1 Tax=Desulfobulbus alkaliphilus TaxID=869814 RepID=UPI001966AA89|nr:hypothetical protein [Desulfobulbus alkaliphilus]MBM9536351.1 hypothetical protein [Desulfobulbus alkaliphilus]